jgi:DNA modification methylase
MTIITDPSAFETIDWNFADAKTNYLTHGLHPYPAKYIPQIPNAIIQKLSKPGEVVADIFCGSGTTLVEALALGRHAVGVDANPLACLISEAKTARFAEGEKNLLQSLAERAQRLASTILSQNTGLFHTPFISSAPRPSSDALTFWFEPFVVEELAEALSWCEAMPTETTRKVSRVVLSSIIVTVSHQDSDTRYVRRKKNIAPGDVLRRFARALRDATGAIAAFTEAADPSLTCKVYQTNVLTKPYIGQVDLVVCSPPYPNAYSYHLYHMTRMVWLGMDQPTFKREEIGSHRKYSSKSQNGATVETFRSEMAEIFGWLRSHLREGGYACFVVGDSTIRGEKISNADLISEVAGQVGFREAGRFSREMQATKKAFNPSHGRIKTERIVILQNCKDSDKSTLLKCRIKPYIQPFERRLALAELASLAGSEPKLFSDTTGDGLEYAVASTVPVPQLTNKLAYWESVRAEQCIITTQALREATINIVRNGVPLEQVEPLVYLNVKSALPNRRCLRYGPHGIHEYRGKFFPQLVRSLINIAKVPAGGIVADPMSGSGTTAVEAVLSGCHAIGLDLNPLSVLIGRTKCALLSVSPSELIEAYKRIHKKTLSASSLSQNLTYFQSLPKKDQEYLRNWFSEHVLSGLDRIATAINTIPMTPTVRDLMKLSLSNIIRRVSWQKEDDLRVRKKMKDEANIDPVGEFLEELQHSVKGVLSLLYYDQGTPIGTFDIQEGDARELPQLWQKFLNQADVVITSPPYATALPYLDTDRLSLSYLGLLSRKSQRQRDQDMIGNREVTESKRKAYWQYFTENKRGLPPSVTELIEKIKRLNSKAEVGFRRKNLSALLAKYFLDMKTVIFGIAQVLKPGASAYVVVGNNHTVAGNEKVDIGTANLLTDIARMVGLEAGEHIPMEMLVSRDIFKKNAVASEVILCFHRPKATQ